METTAKQNRIRTDRTRESQKQAMHNSGSALALEIVDPFHRQWPDVLALVSRRGQRRVLMLDTDGWLSARQSVITAFLDGRPIGFLVFHVEPTRMADGRLAMAARLDALSTEGAAGNGELGRDLSDFARAHAIRVLNCRFFDAVGHLAA